MPTWNRKTAIAYPVDDGIEVLSQGQGIYDDREQIAKLLGLTRREGARQIGSQRRWIWRQRGFDRTRTRRIDGLFASSSGQGSPDPRRIDHHERQAPPDLDGLHHWL